MSTTPSTPSYLPLAQQLAALTGEDIEEAIKKSVQQRLKNVSPMKKPLQQSNKKLMELQKFIAQNFPKGMIDTHADLYDELGLPK
jgi:hypothetical protein